MGISSGCGLYQGADDIDIDPSFGPTEVTRCSIVTGVNYEDMTSSLAAFASHKKAKFVDSLYYGLHSSDLQVDDPYVIVTNNFYLYAIPPKHVLEFQQSGKDPRAQAFEDELYDWLMPMGSRKPCDGSVGNRGPKRVGWRLSDKHYMPKTE